MVRPIIISLFICICFSCTKKVATTLVSNNTKPSEDKSLTADLEVINQWFAGEYNNFQQVHKEKEDSVKAEMVHENIHSIFEPVPVPWMGKYVYYVKQYMDNDPKKVYRQRMYNFHINTAENAIQLDIYSFKDKMLDSIYTNGHKEKSLFDMLTQKDLTSSPGCEVFWKKSEDNFVGYMKPRACNFISKRSGKRIYITDSLMLNDKEIWIRDEAEDEDGNYVFGHKAKIPHKLKKCTYYSGWAATKKEGAESMEAIRGLRLHNQGDRQNILFSDGTPTPYELRLAKVIYGKDLEVLQLGLYKTGAEKPISYLWTDPSSNRIGINLLGVFQSGLTIVNK